MKKAFLLILLSAQIIFAQSTQLYKDYGIRSFSSSRLYLDARDFFSFNRSNQLDNGSNSTNYNSNFGIIGNYFKQSDLSEYSISGNGALNYYYYSSNSSLGSHTTEYTQSYVSLSALTKRYINDKYGFFGFLQANVNFAYNFKEEKNQNSDIISLGVGYGRVVDVKFVAQAYIISDELNANLSNEDIFNLAEVLEKEYDGYYYMEFKDDYFIHFYDDINKITKRPEQIGKITQIISSSVYKTAQKRIGYEAKIGTTLSFYDKDRFNEFTNTNDIFAAINYAYPIDFNKQFTASVSYVKNMHEKIFNAPRFNANIIFSIDHNYHWSSSILASYECIYPKDEIPAENFSIAAQSELVVINSLSAYLDLSYSKESFFNSSNTYSSIGYKTNKVEGMSTHFGLRYYIF